MTHVAVGPQNPKMFSFFSHYFTNVQWNFPEATGHEMSQRPRADAGVRVPLSSSETSPPTGLSTGPGFTILVGEVCTAGPAIPPRKLR